MYRDLTGMRNIVFILFKTNFIGILERDNETDVYTVKMLPKYKELLKYGDVEEFPQGRWEGCPQFILDRIPAKDSGHWLHMRLNTEYTCNRYDPMEWLKVLPGFKSEDLISFSKWPQNEGYYGFVKEVDPTIVMANYY